MFHCEFSFVVDRVRSMNALYDIISREVCPVHFAFDCDDPSQFCSLFSVSLSKAVLSSLAAESEIDCALAVRLFDFCRLSHLCFSDFETVFSSSSRQAVSHFSDQVDLSIHTAPIVKVMLVGSIEVIVKSEDYEKK